MKKKFIPMLICGTIAGCGLLMESCNKDLPTNIAFDSYTYSSTDEDGGTWKQILVTDPSSIPCPAPADVTSSEYQDELSVVKSFNGALNNDQQDAVDYWGNNTMIRWMEITMEFVAKYNLAPAPNPDGTYPSPNSADPSAYPNFPFAHPPYAARAYAYLSAACYDALVTAWHYKYLYNREAPYAVDNSITPAYPDNKLPSYPSEDAVIASVMEDLLKFLFPLESDNVTQKAEEVRNTRLWAGMNVQSDLDAGDSIGHAVAAMFLTRAKNDSMKYAQVDPVTYQGMEDEADIMWSSQWPHWECLEVPQRPVGITPKYSHVTPWWIPSVEAVRAPAPPAIGTPEYEDGVKELQGFLNNLTPDQEHSAFYWSDGFSTFTPPGHWNWIANGYIIQYQLNPLRTARVLAYLNTTMEDAGIACWDDKYYYFYPRPTNTEPDITTLFLIPNFPSYTSGHSMFDGSGSKVLDYFFPAESAEIDAMARDAANSRVYARIHWRWDVEAGLTSAFEVASYSTAAAAADGGGLGN